jgi:hypothetical protein
MTDNSHCLPEGPLSIVRQVADTRGSGRALIVECRRTKREMEDEDDQQYRSQSVLLLE